MSLGRMGAATGFAFSPRSAPEEQGNFRLVNDSARAVNFLRPCRGVRFGTQIRWLRLFA